jgi:hypothetical protein
MVDAVVGCFEIYSRLFPSSWSAASGESNRSLPISPLTSMKYLPSRSCLMAVFGSSPTYAISRVPSFCLTTFLRESFMA